MKLILPFLLAASLPVAAFAQPDAAAATVTLTKLGTCPGIITLTVSGATPNSNVALLYGVPFPFTYNGVPCTGITLGVINPNGTPPTVGTVQPANGGGVLVVSPNVPPALCGFSVQAVDIATCTTSNIVVL